MTILSVVVFVELIVLVTKWSAIVFGEVVILTRNASGMGLGFRP